MSEIKQMIRKLREGTMGLPSGLELEAAELLERLTSEPIEKLSRAWNENKCGDDECEAYRLKAAIAVLTGGITHKENADKLYAAPPAAQGMVSVPRAELEWMVEQWDDSLPSHELTHRLYDVVSTAKKLLHGD